MVVWWWCCGCSCAGAVVWLQWCDCADVLVVVLDVVMWLRRCGMVVVVQVFGEWAVATWLFGCGVVIVVVDVW